MDETDLWVKLVIRSGNTHSREFYITTPQYGDDNLRGDRAGETVRGEH